MLELLVSQILDPFRIGLVFFLLVTAIRTRAATGLATSLAVGVVFVAVLIPLTTGAAALTDNAARLTAMAVGIVANALILAVLLAGWLGWKKLRG
jgi:hypothetical protein